MEYVIGAYHVTNRLEQFFWRLCRDEIEYTHTQIKCCFRFAKDNSTEQDDERLKLCLFQKRLALT